MPESHAIAAWTPSPEQLATLRKHICKDLSDVEFGLFVEYCKGRGLNPLLKEVYAIRRSGQVSYQTSIDGFRTLSESTGEFEGLTPAYWCGPDGQWVDVWLGTGNKPPFAAKIGVYRKGFREPVWAVARFDAYNAGGPMWQRMSDNQLAKCAEALAHRKAFPRRNGGMYIAEEMHQAGEVRAEVVAAPVRLVPPMAAAPVVAAVVADTGSPDAFLVRNGKNAGKRLGELSGAALEWYAGSSKDPLLRDKAQAVLDRRVQAMALGESQMGESHVPYDPETGEVLEARS